MKFNIILAELRDNITNYSSLLKASVSIQLKTKFKQKVTDFISQNRHLYTINAVKNEINDILKIIHEKESVNNINI